MCDLNEYANNNFKVDLGKQEEKQQEHDVTPFVCHTNNIFLKFKSHFKLATINLKIL